MKNYWLAQENEGMNKCPICGSKLVHRVVCSGYSTTGCSNDPAHYHIGSNMVGSHVYVDGEEFCMSCSFWDKARKEQELAKISDKYDEAIELAKRKYNHKVMIKDAIG